MLTVIDTQTCNIQSVCNALKRIGADFEIATERDTVTSADAIILPGVGAIAPAMTALRERGLVDVLTEKASQGLPIFGICLGMQMLAESSTEHGDHDGLGLIPGNVIRLEISGPDCRVPNIGWYDCRPEGNGVLFPASAKNQTFYFVHSYHFACTDPASVAATIDYGGQKIAAAVEHGNVFGVQFHPEKSQDHGLALLDRFVSHVKARN